MKLLVLLSQQVKREKMHPNKNYMKAKDVSHGLLALLGSFLSACDKNGFIPSDHLLFL